MTGYTKLFGCIIASTIWRESDKTRLVWITMLALADRYGDVHASMPGLADLARVPTEACKEALGALSAPDEHSRTPDHEGRRIEAIDGGWHILNHGKYREKMNSDERREYFRQKQQECRARKKSTEGASKNCQTMSMTVKDCLSESKKITHAEAEAEEGIPPISPKGDLRAADSESKPKTPPSKTPTTPEALRLCRIAGRRETTQWDDKEIKKYRELFRKGSFTEENFGALEVYYKREKSKGDEGRHRRNLAQLLNNFAGELDRAFAEPAKVNGHVHSRDANI